MRDSGVPRSRWGYWWRHRRLVMLYAILAVFTGSLAITVGFIAMMTLAHMVRPG